MAQRRAALLLLVVVLPGCTIGVRAACPSACHLGTLFSAAATLEYTYAPVSEQMCVLHCQYKGFRDAYFSLSLDGVNICVCLMPGCSSVAPWTGVTVGNERAACAASNPGKSTPKGGGGGGSPPWVKYTGCSTPSRNTCHWWTQCPKQMRCNVLAGGKHKCCCKDKNLHPIVRDHKVWGCK